MKNQEIAAMFTEMGEMLEFLGENPFRVRAYLQAARVLADLEYTLNLSIDSIR